MAIQPIRKIGDPVLRMKAREVKEVTEKTRKLVENLFDTMYDAPGVGLAAPQIGVSQRVVVIDVDDNPFVLINPVIIEKDGNQVGEEGCLSVPGERYLVNRAQKVKVRAINLDGEEYEIEGEDFVARAMQHEIDHLDGTLFVDKIVRVSDDV